MKGKKWISRIRHPVRVSRFWWARRVHSRYRCIDCDPPLIIRGRGKRARARADAHAATHVGERNRRGQRALAKGRAVSLAPRAKNRRIHRKTKRKNRAKR